MVGVALKTPSIAHATPPRSPGKLSGCATQEWRLLNFPFLCHNSERIETHRKEPPCLTILLPWRPIDHNFWRSSSAWVIFGQVPLLQQSAAAASLLAIAPNLTTLDMIRSSA